MTLMMLKGLLRLSCGVMLLGLITAFLVPSSVLAQSPTNLTALEGFTTSATGTVLLVVGDYAINPRGTKPDGVGFQAGRDSTPLGFIAGMLTNDQSFAFDTNTADVASSTGRPIGSYSLIFSIGGADVNAVTNYYETTSTSGDRAPVSWSEPSGSSGNDVWTDRNGTVIYTTPHSTNAVPPGTSDVFEIQILTDSSSRLVVILDGTTYTGTWAAAFYFRFVIYPNISSYTNGYYIIRWTDASSGPSANYIPDIGDTYTILATAPS